MVPLVREKVIVYDSRDEEIPAGPPHPLYVFGFVALICLAISFLDYKRKKLSVWSGCYSFWQRLAGGTMLFFLWFFTDHNDSAYNFNLLWAMPTHLIALFAFGRKPSWLEKYFLVIAILQGLLLLTWWVLPQAVKYSTYTLVVCPVVEVYLCSMCCGNRQFNNKRSTLSFNRFDLNGSIHFSDGFFYNVETKT